MVRACCVPQCSSGVTIPAYHFPKDIKRSESWASEIHCPVILKLTSTERRKYRVCYKHFDEETSYLCTSQRRRLKHDAIPTLHLPVKSEKMEYANENVEAELKHDAIPTLHLPVKSEKMEYANENVEAELKHDAIPTFHLPVKSEKTEYTDENVEAEEYLVSATSPGNGDSNHEKMIIPVNEKAAWEINEHNKAGPSISSGQLELCSTPQKSQSVLLRGNLKKCHLTPNAAKLYNIFKKLMKRNCYAHRKREDLKARLKRATALSESDLINRFENLSTTQRMLIQMLLCTSSPMSQGRRYTTDEKILALTLLKQSRKSYKLLRKLYNLPSETTLKKMLRKIPVQTGISEVMMEHLHHQADTMSAQEKLCILMWDKMTLKPHVDYDINSGKIIGFEDWGTRRTSRFADHALVFMIRGLNSGWIMPISYNYCEGQTQAPQLIQCIKNIVKALKKIGLQVVATVCDQGSSNVVAINRLQADTLMKKWKQGTKRPRSDIIEINNIQLIPFYDPPQLIKGIRNNLLNKDLEINVTSGRKECERQFASWRIIQQAYNMDNAGYVVRPMMKKLTNEHVIHQRIKKTRVKYALQVFSESVASYIGFLSCHQCVVETDHGPLKLPKEEGLTTAEVLDFFNKLFDSVNGHIAASEAPLRTVISEASAHEKFWSDAMRSLKCMRYVHPITKVPESRALCLKNWMKTISSFKILWSFLKTQGFKNLKTRLVNQDPLKNLFGCIRFVRHSNVQLTPYSFQMAYKIMLINNITSSHSVDFDCEDVCSGHFLFTLRKLLTEEVEEEAIQSAMFKVVMEKTSAAFKDTENITQERYEEINNCAILKEIICVSPHKECELCKASFGRLNQEASIQNVLKNIDTMLHKTMPHVYFRSKLQKYMENMLHAKINFLFVRCTQHSQQIKQRILTVKVSHFIGKWCMTVNNILCGKDLRRRRDAVLRQTLLKHTTLRRSVRRNKKKKKN